MNDQQDNQERAAQTKSDNIENVEQYLLYNKAAIVQKLRQLIKSKSMVTAHFNQGKHSFLTLVVDVLPDKDLLVLDYGSDEKLTAEMFAANRAVFKTSYEGITAQFSCEGFQRAKRHGKASIACPLPDALLWVQRREYYRVKVPLSEMVTCEVLNPQDEPLQLPALDLSVAGLALHHTDEAIEFEEGQIYNACKLNIPGNDPVQVNLEIRNIIPIGTLSSAGYRVGTQFINTGMDTSSVIQRYIQSIETQLTRN